MGKNKEILRKDESCMLKQHSQGELHWENENDLWMRVEEVVGASLVENCFFLSLFF